MQPALYLLMVVKRNEDDGRYRKAMDSLRSARIDAKLSQGALAAKLGKRQQFVSKYESGERRLDVIEFLDIAHALQLNAVRLLLDLTSEEQG